jgi:TPR repeat protein
LNFEASRRNLRFMKRALQGLLIVVVAAALARDPAYTQSADLVLCDRVAADPADPDKPADAKGVADIAASDIATAIKFCKSAANSSRRAMFQLGRAYAANRQTAEAMAAWRKAADKGSSSAMVELGVLYGTGAGVARDEAQARKLFERAAIRAASATSPPSAAEHHPIRRVRANCCRRPPRPMPRRSINSA